VGASTCVFSVLGMMSAYSWRERFAFPQRWARRWGPLVAGVILLGWTGSGGEGSDVDVDVVAHLGGFAAGALLGTAAALPRMQPLLQRVPQWLSGGAALASLGIAWGCALRS
jgi:membrane associated rhomboid family serine protease